jgi:hypothetical protein
VLSQITVVPDPAEPSISSQPDQSHIDLVLTALHQCTLSRVGLARSLDDMDGIPTASPTPLRALRRLHATVARHEIDLASAEYQASLVPGGVAGIDRWKSTEVQLLGLA